MAGNTVLQCPAKRRADARCHSVFQLCMALERASRFVASLAAASKQVKTSSAQISWAQDTNTPFWTKSSAASFLMAEAVLDAATSGRPRLAWPAP